MYDRDAADPVSIEPLPTLVRVALLQAVLGVAGCLHAEVRGSVSMPDTANTQYATISRDEFLTNPVRATYRTVIDTLAPSVVAVASDTVIEASCDGACQLPSSGSPLYRIRIVRALFARPGVLLPRSIVVRGSWRFEIPRGRSFMSLVHHDVRDPTHYDYFLTSGISSVGVQRGNVALYRSDRSDVLTYRLRSDSWIGCFYRKPMSASCTAELFRGVHIASPAQRKAYGSLQSRDFSVGLFWGAVLKAFPNAEFPTTPCAAGETLELCTYLEVQALKTRIGFQPAD